MEALLGCVDQRVHTTTDLDVVNFYAVITEKFNSPQFICINSLKKRVEVSTDVLVLVKYVSFLLDKYLNKSPIIADYRFRQGTLPICRYLVDIGTGINQ